MSAPRRRGGRATSFSAATVLLRAARMAGTSVAASATAIASADDLRHRARRDRWRACGADQGGAGVGEQRRGQPSGAEPDRPRRAARARGSRRGRSPRPRSACRRRPSAARPGARTPTAGVRRGRPRSRSRAARGASAPARAPSCPSWTSSASSDAIPSQLRQARDGGNGGRASRNARSDERPGVAGAGELQVEQRRSSAGSPSTSARVASASVIQITPTSSRSSSGPGSAGRVEPGRAGVGELSKPSECRQACRSRGSDRAAAPRSPRSRRR